MKLIHWILGFPLTQYLIPALVLFALLAKTAPAADSIPLDIPTEKMQRLEICMFAGDVASSVQSIRHQFGDSQAKFENKIKAILNAYNQPEHKLRKIISIGREVYKEPIEFKRSEIFVIYYNQCINGFDINDEGSFM